MGRRISNPGGTSARMAWWLDIEMPKDVVNRSMAVADRREPDERVVDVIQAVRHEGVTKIGVVRDRPANLPRSAWTGVVLIARLCAS